MASLDSLMRRTRIELADVKEPFYERFGMSGSGVRVDLPVENIETLFLYPEGNPDGLLVAGTDYTLEPRRGVITFHEPPATGTRFVAEGESGKYFSDEEIQLFVETAFQMHTRNRNPGVNYSGLPDVEVLLVAILAQIEALWVLKTSAAYDVNIHAPEGMFVPRGQRFQQLNTLVMEMEARYKELSNALGVGLYAVEMFTLRRVSRQTGRYVPIYLDREIDDTRPPQRVLPSINSQGLELPASTVAKHDLNVFQGRPFREVFTLFEEDADLDLAGMQDFTVNLFRTPYQTQMFRDPTPQFSYEVVAAEGQVIVTMSAEDTAKLETTGSYVWNLIWDTPGDSIPLLQGRVLVESTYPLKNVNVRVG